MTASEYEYFSDEYLASLAKGSRRPITKAMRARIANSIAYLQKELRASREGERQAAVRIHELEEELRRQQPVILKKVPAPAGRSRPHPQPWAGLAKLAGVNPRSPEFLGRNGVL